MVLNALPSISHTNFRRETRRDTHSQYRAKVLRPVCLLGKGVVELASQALGLRRSAVRVSNAFRRARRRALRRQRQRVQARRRLSAAERVRASLGREHVRKRVPGLDVGLMCITRYAFLEGVRNFLFHGEFPFVP
eukprot:CAMPEP_0117634588 /NCGR_PEP_ID=MMETSP0802-20121206/5770_1 /TAXON_ID=38833 /ORGANISM="Micromonas sp., Strain CCMP2099" /LENGTH=134 /DNA_ID=CAMNT_0005439257 /DNA_START=68 /DNA_END=472 /DNA_ORIENTATION=+